MNATLVRPSRRSPGSRMTASSTSASVSAERHRMNPPRCRPGIWLAEAGRREREPEHAPLARPRCLPHHRVGRPSRPAADSRSPAAIADRICELLTGAPVHLERGHDDDLEPARGAQLGERLGRPRPLVAERRVRRHQEAVEGHPRGEPADERVVWRLAQAAVEVDDHGRLDARGLEPLDPLVRVAQDRRRAAGEHLVGMVVEGDDDGPGTAATGLGARGARAGTRDRDGGRRTRRRPRTRGSTRTRSRPGRRRLALRRPRQPPRRCARGAVARGHDALDEDLVRVQRPGDGGAHRHDRPVGAHREHDRGVADRERRLRGR